MVFLLFADLSMHSRALELGITHLDTSDMYGPHTNEQFVGELLAAQFLTCATTTK